MAQVNVDVQPERTTAKDDVLRHAAPGAVHLDGWLGDRIDAAIANRVFAQDIDRIIAPYRARTESNDGHWRCEYWGKWFLSAAMAAGYDASPDHHARLSAALDRLLATQDPDGYIGTYRADAHLGTWDVWGRKYTLLGLIAAHDLTGDEAPLRAACRVADHLLAEAPPEEIKLVENGIGVLKGLPPSSVLQPIATLYQRTAEPRYRAFAEQLLASWSQPTKYFPHGPRLIEQGLEGVPPSRIGARKAYEMMSCFEGVCEMYRITGRRELLDAAIGFAESIRSHERMISGSGSNQELWCDGVRCQTETLEQPMETCVTVTWMNLCDQLLRLTGDSRWADEIEISLYNALVSAMTPDGRWWAYFSPLAGQRVPSHFQHADVGLSCCVANGPRGLLLPPRMAVMTGRGGITVNLYGAGSASVPLDDGTEVQIQFETDYPRGDAVRMRIRPERPTSFPLHLRIPSWSTRTELSVNGVAVDVAPGRYHTVAREWRDGDVVTITFDMRGRAMQAPSGAPQLAIMRGPILLALDDRLTDPADVAVRLVADEQGFVALEPHDEAPDDMWMAYRVPFEVRPSHFFKHHRLWLGMCDYASAGNRWQSGNRFRAWLPQPLFLADPYPRDTWKLMVPERDDCPIIEDFVTDDEVAPGPALRTRSP
jgi:hypothetical protein